MNLWGLMRRREIVREILTTLAKASIALAIFAGIVIGWTKWQISQAQAFTASLPLPDETVQDGCAVWFVGSSSMSRWASLQRDMRPWTTHNRSIAGATLEELNTRFLNEDQPQVPQAIVFYAGENDIAFGGRAADTIRHFAEFMKAKRQRLGAVPVFFVSVKPSPTRWANLPAQTEYNRAVAAMTRSQTDLFFINTVPSLMAGDRPGPFYNVDGIHLNDAGYQVWSRAVHAALDRTLPAALVRRCRQRAAHA
jgi:lysophospholipase L1-like esterase